MNHHRRHRRFRVGDYVRNVASVRNLPPFCEIYHDDQDPPYVGHFVAVNQVDVDYAISEGDVQVVSDCWRGDSWDSLPAGYRGLVLHESDHGNLTLYYHFKNGNNREIWGIV
jgi:hypothetical protein